MKCTHLECEILRAIAQHADGKPLDADATINALATVAAVCLAAADLGLPIAVLMESSSLHSWQPTGQAS